MRIISTLIFCFVFIVVFNHAIASTVYFCEVVESVEIGFTEKHKAGRTRTIGKKFKMEVTPPQTFPGGRVRFSDSSPINGEFEIHDSWGGVSSKFIAREISPGITGTLHFYEGYVTFTDIGDLSGFDGPVFGLVSTANCDKF